ncbi:MAG: hypothetical protein IKC91_03335 [Clostridia bacterium]|nr:hypothetical protein [Clostridia bacterium]
MIQRRSVGTVPLLFREELEKLPSPLSPCNVGKHAGHYPRPQTQRAHVRPVSLYALSAYGASLFCSANGWATLPPLGFLFSLTVL